jgi:LPS export ABC transporter permease LptG/LPS export ABC transporter permease LptF
MLMRRLDRYIFAEILGPLALGFLVYTFILLLQALFKAAELIIRSGVAFGTIGELLLLSMPSIVVLTIPMSLLFGILIAIGRLSADSELVAIRASGISLFSLYRPILVLSLALTGLNVYFMAEVLPQGNHALQQLRVEILTQSLTEEIQPRIPHTGWANKVLYVFEAPPGERRWKGVFLSDAVPTQENEIWLAEWGRAHSDGSEVVLSLENASVHVVDLRHPEDYRLAHYQSIDQKLPSAVQQPATSAKRGLRELALRDLIDHAFGSEHPEMIRKLAEIELHKKFSIPAACLVFGLLGLPLGFSNARGGRSSGFAISIGVILVYYVILNSGEDVAREGTVPVWLAVWFPNLALLALGIFLLARRNRDKSLLLTHLDQWIREHLWGRLLHLQRRREVRQVARRRAQLQSRRDRANLVLRLPELRLRFPNSMDRYILQIFVKILVLAFLAGTTVYVVADLSDKTDEIIENQIPWWPVVIDYYKFKTFSIIYEIAPIIVLVTTLITFGVLSRTNELTAAKALGMSLYRLAVPVLLAVALVSGTNGLLQSEVLAASSSRMLQLEAIIRGQDAAAKQHRGASQRWLYGEGNQLYNFAYYDEERRELQRLQIFKFDDEYRMIGRLMARRATYAEDGWWVFSSGWTRTWTGQSETSFQRFEEPLRYRLGEGPEFFAGGLSRPEEMSYAELRQYVSELRATGQDVPQLEVALHNKIAYPVISLVMALVALPFAFKMGRRGALYGIGLSLVLGVVLLVVLSIFQALGENGVLPPLVAVWSPSALFSIFSLYLFLGVRT